MSKINCKCISVNLTHKLVDPITEEDAVKRLFEEKLSKKQYLQDLATCEKLEQAVRDQSNGKDVLLPSFKDIIDLYYRLKK